MWDATLTSRVKDRKMNEIFTFAAMIKVDSSKKSQYIRLIDALSNDIDACEALLASNGEARPALGIIDCPEYISRLSVTERSDEDEFNSYKVVPSVSTPDDGDVVDQVRELILKAAEGITSTAANDAELQSVKADLDACMAENTELKDQVLALRGSMAAFNSIKDQLALNRTRLEDSNKKLDEAEKQVSDLKAEIEGLKASSGADDASSQELEDARSRIADLEKENNRLLESVEGVSALKDELSICRGRIESLSNELEFARSQVAVAEESKPAVDLSWIDEKLSPIILLLDQIVDSESQTSEYYVEKLNEAGRTIDSIISDAESQLSDASLEGIMESLRKVYSVQTSVGITLQLFEMNSNGKSVEENVAEVETAPEVEAVEEKPVYDQIMSDDEMQILTVVSLMKNSKIDFFVDMSMSGRFNESACDDVVEFLKVDLAIIKDILSMDFTSKESIEDNLRDILNIIDSASAPKHQKMYINSLTKEEKVLEDSYNKIIEHLQNEMNDRYTYLLE